MTFGVAFSKPITVASNAATRLRLMALTWLQQQSLDGCVQEPFQSLVLFFRAQDFALVLGYRVFNGAENLFGGRCQPVVHKHVQQLELSHVFSCWLSPGAERPSVYIQ